MFHNIFSSLPFVAEESKDWKKFCQKIQEKYAISPIVNEENHPEKGDALYEICSIIKQLPKVYNREKKKNLYCLFQIPLYILNNKDFLTVALKNHNDVLFYLNGEKDKQLGLFRTNHGFSFYMKQQDPKNCYKDIPTTYEALEKLSRCLNDICRRYIKEKKIDDLLKKCENFGPWLNRLPSEIVSEMRLNLYNEKDVVQRKAEEEEKNKKNIQNTIN